MKLSTPRSLIFASLLLLFIHSRPSLASFLPQISITYAPNPVVQVSNPAANSTEESSDDDQNYYQLVTFISFLQTYNFTNAWLGEDTSNDGTSGGLIIHTCFPNPAALNQAMGIYCSLVSSFVSESVSSMQSFDFDFKDAENYMLNSQDSQLVFTGVPTNVSTQTNSQPASNQTCVGNLTYSFINADSQQPYNYATDQLVDLRVQVLFQDQNCSAQITTPLLMSDQPSYMSDQAYPYIFLMLGIAMVQLLSCSSLVKALNESDIVSRRISAGMLAFFVGFGFYVFLRHFLYWMTMQGLILGVFVLNFVVSLFLEPTMIYFIFRSAKRTNDFALIMAMFYKLCFWLFFISAAIVLSFTVVPDCILYVYPLFLLPQILDNVLSGRKYKWNFRLLLGVGCPHFLYIVYMAFDPLNLFNRTTDIKIVIFCFSVFFVQLIILQIQTKKPSLGIKVKGKYVYSDLGSPQEKEAAFADVCSICMEKLNQQPLNGSIGTTEPLLEQTHTGATILRTPCKHYYHESCLQEWVKKKLECPNCRQAIPSLGEDEDE